jgi:hypothetical protein
MGRRLTDRASPRAGGALGKGARKRVAASVIIDVRTDGSVRGSA